MVEYICNKCGNKFSNNGNLKRHNNRKVPCIAPEKLKILNSKKGIEMDTEMDTKFTFIDLFAVFTIISLL